MLEYTDTNDAPKAIGPYSQAIRFENLLFLSGAIPLDPDTGEVVGDTIEEQTKQVIKNITSILNANNIDFKHVIKTTCFLSDMQNFADFNKVYETAFISKPACSCIAVKELPKKVFCEIELIAYI